MKFALSEKEIQRYGRQLLIPEIGGAGQEKLKKASVLVVGTGGLGSAIAYYLAAAGVGRIGIVDGDRVDLSNLQRQILHFTPDIGRPKVESAREKLQALNPEIEIVPYYCRLEEGNAEEIVRDYQVVVDGSDNFPTRYLINETCLKLRRPFIHGGVLGLKGQVMTIMPYDGPCYRCVFRDIPAPEEVPSCAQAGVLGTVPGLIGMIEATEAIKIILGVGELLVGRLLQYDALTMRFREIELERDEECPACGQKIISQG
ncbi:MAG: molybdopterin-synthase adenylyltransferase [Eubacteriales bacterium]|nr:molybdopterin-synthase adenylyltransferase [Eubacteriales bacterium]